MEGLVEGRVETLLRQLRRRFGTLPSQVVACLTAAAPADLDRWTDRILDAASLTELMAH